CAPILLYLSAAEDELILQNLTVSPDLRSQVQGLVEFEQMLANNFSTDDTTRRTYARSWNLMDVEQLRKFSFINWKLYLQ
ncbi:hypothetical protein GCK32_017137, partial [Trichostrongylus colubriformis]